jgi:hypothetical protein
MSIHEFPGIATLPAGASRTVTLGINFNDTTQSAKFDLVKNLFKLSIFFSRSNNSGCY